MRPVAEAEHGVVLRDEHAYVAHPHLIRNGRGELLLVCNWAPRRAFVLHPPEDPLYLNLLLRSGDDGLTWSPPAVAPAYGWNGVECAGLTDLGGGRVLLNQWRFAWHTLDAARGLQGRDGLALPEQLAVAHLASGEHEPGPLTVAAAEHLMPWARGPGRAWVHRSDDGGRTWAGGVELDTAPLAGGYGMRGGVVLPDGALLLPLGDAPGYRAVHAFRSTDGGQGWRHLAPAAERPGRRFEEPAPLLLASGRVLLLLRENRSKSLWRTWSDDGGASWAEPEPAGIDGYPAHLCRLPDGRLLCSFGFRRAPFAIRAALSEDQGRTWPSGAIRDVRSGLPGRDLGYPCTLPCADGRLLSVYHARDGQGVTGVHATRWRLPPPG